MLPKLYRSDVEIRRHQINTLQIFNENVVEVCEGLEYHVGFTSGQKELCLTVSLSNDFPNERPFLKVVPTVVHPWVNSEGEITSAPGLLNFTIHSDLGRVVQAIIRDFERNPPPLISECPRSAITSPTIAIREGERSSPSYGAISKLSSPTNTYNFNPRLTFPELSKLSIVELEFLNNSVDRQQEFVNDIPAVKEHNKLIDDLIAEVEELAESNLSKQDQLMELKSNVNQRIEKVTKLAFENERLHVKYQNLSDKYSPSNIKEQLRIASEQAEQESEKIANSFLKGELDVDQFVNMFTGSRSLCQTRQIKQEKLSQQLDNLHKAGL